MSILTCRSHTACRTLQISPFPCFQHDRISKAVLRSAADVLYVWRCRSPPDESFSRRWEESLSTEVAHRDVSCCVSVKSPSAFLGNDGGAQARCCGFRGTDLHLLYIFLKSLVLKKMFCRVRLPPLENPMLNTFIYCGSSSSKHITSDLPSSLLIPQNKMVTSAWSILVSRDLLRNWRVMTLFHLSPLPIHTVQTMLPHQLRQRGWAAWSPPASWLCLMSSPQPSSYVRASSPTTKKKKDVQGKSRIICSWCIIHVSFLSQEHICYSHAVPFMVPYPLLWWQCEKLRAKERATFCFRQGKFPIPTPQQHQELIFNISPE